MTALDVRAHDVRRGDRLVTFDEEPWRTVAQVSEPRAIETASGKWRALLKVSFTDGTTRYIGANKIVTVDRDPS